VVSKGFPSPSDLEGVLTLLWLELNRCLPGLCWRSALSHAACGGDVTRLLQGTLPALGARGFLGAAEL